MQISAVIPTKNRPDDLERAVQSVLEQTRIPDELVIIDQSDDDLSKNVVHELINAADKKLELIYVLDSEIAGLIPAKRASLDYSSGDLVCFLEDDIVLEAGYLKAMETAFLNKPEMLGSCGLVTEGAKTNSVYLFLFHLFHRGIFRDKRVGLHGKAGSAGKDLIQSNFLSGGLSAYRREVFEVIKFDTVNDFFMLEDVDFSTRAVKHFGPDRFFINPNARLVHNMSPTNRSRLGPRWERKAREFILFYKKHRDQTAALLNLIWLFIGLTVESMYSAVRLLHPGPVTGLVRGMYMGVNQGLLPLE
jgi:glycosyltransferase involved in cell wall biosynthesis